MHPKLSVLDDLPDGSDNLCDFPGFGVVSSRPAGQRVHPDYDVRIKPPPGAVSKWLQPCVKHHWQDARRCHWCHVRGQHRCCHQRGLRAIANPARGAAPQGAGGEGVAEGNTPV
jgi:hypothetical protein